MNENTQRRITEVAVEGGQRLKSGGRERRGKRENSDMRRRRRTRGVAPQR